MNNEELKETDMLYARESLMMNITEDILVAMEDKNISKANLAKLLDKSKAFVTQMLGGSRNMTLRSLSDIAFALDMEVSIKLIPRKDAVDCNFYSNQWENSNIVALSFCYQSGSDSINKSSPIADDCENWKAAA
jgi:transcriptional regulator with XRE-family HTH domain